MAKQLRFAALIRVSTEKQEKEGESLRTQKTQNEASIRSVGGKNTILWYGGQEHATPGYEKSEVDRLIRDATVGKFEAVIVNNADRWSRDNAKSMEGLEVFKRCGISFYVGTTAYDLFNPEHEMFLGMSAVIGRFQARHQNKKSLQNKIHRAKRGIPSSGSLPFGRKFDKKSGQWSVDPNVQAQMQDIARRYLAGESIVHLAQEYGVKETTLYDRMNFCGSKWKMKFASKELNIHEAVEIEIPALLDEATVAAIRAKARANTTYTHGQLKHKYLFSRMVFCGECKRAMSGQFALGHRYYRRAADCKCHRGFIRADDLEAVVVRHLFHTFGNPSAVARALEQAMPNNDKLEEYERRLARLTEDLTKVEKGRSRIIRLVADGHLEDEHVEMQLNALAERELVIKAEIERINAQLGYRPTPEVIEKIADQACTAFRGMSSMKRRAIVRHANTDFSELTWNDARELAITVFGGKTPDGDRMGIYLRPTPGERWQWQYALHGHLFNVEGGLPMSESLMDTCCGKADTNDFATTPSLVRSPGPWVPTPPRKCSPPRRSRRRGGG